jgi:3-hydroxybutyryl-CoA dehydrogenase
VVSAVSAPGKVAIIGFGLMGAQIAQVFAQSGYSVSVYDVNDEQLSTGFRLIREGRYGLDNSVSRGRITQVQADGVLSRLSRSNSIEHAAGGAEIVLEAAIEDIEIKRRIMQKASFVTNGVLASNTSTLSISKISESLERKIRERILGMHFFNPPQIMKLVEIVRTSESSPEALQKIKTTTESLGKIPIMVFDSPGFIANRIGLSVFAEASTLLEKKIASVRDIDLAMRLGYGYPMGPFELGDLVGLDTRLRNMDSIYSETGDERFRPPEILKQLVSSGYLGDPKTKKGSKGGYYEFFGEQRPSENPSKQS